MIHIIEIPHQRPARLIGSFDTTTEAAYSDERFDFRYGTMRDILTQNGDDIDNLEECSATDREAVEKFGLDTPVYQWGIVNSNTISDWEIATKPEAEHLWECAVDFFRHDVHGIEILEDTPGEVPFTAHRGCASATLVSEFVAGNGHQALAVASIVDRLRGIDDEDEIHDPTDEEIEAAKARAYAD